MHSPSTDIFLCLHVASALRLPRWPWLPPACGAASLSGVPSPPTQVHHGQAGWVGLVELVRVNSFLFSNNFFLR